MNGIEYAEAMENACQTARKICEAEVMAERERCAKAAEWFSNIEHFTAAQVAARIRSGK